MALKEHILLHDNITLAYPARVKNGCVPATWGKALQSKHVFALVSEWEFSFGKVVDWWVNIYVLQLLLKEVYKIGKFSLKCLLVPSGFWRLEYRMTRKESTVCINNQCIQTTSWSVAIFSAFHGTLKAHTPFTKEWARIYNPKPHFFPRA
jgi:hypothetical protein